MSGLPRDPGDPAAWLVRARGNLKLAAMTDPDVMFEELCFNAQQAAEKAIKGVCVSRRVRFPYVHDIRALLNTLIESGMEIPPAVWDAQDLTPFAFKPRYPLPAEPIDETEYRRALSGAEVVVRWAEQVIDSQ